MKYLFFLPHYPSFCWSGIYGIILDQVEILARDGHQVRLIYCSDCSTLGECYHNHVQPEKVCKLCHFNRNYLLSKLSEKVEKVPVSAYAASVTTPPPMKYDSIEDILKLSYKSVHIGYAAMSTYISYGVRNIYPLIDEQFHAYLDRLLARCCRFTDVVEAAVADYKPDSVGLFNARLIDDRPVVDICRREAIDFTCYEHRFILGNQPRKTSFHNSTPHCEADVRKRIEEIWNEPAVPDEEKIALGKSFFENRRRSIAAGDKVYTGDQQTGLLPEDWDKSKHNIVIFNSSEDEMSYVLEDNQAGALVPTQLDGFETIFDMNKDRDDIHFYIRIHPNLKNIPYLYSTLLPKYGEKYANVTVIPGDSPISTYSLIDVADKVLVFGSTAGAEAASKAQCRPEGSDPGPQRRGSESHAVFLYRDRHGPGGRGSVSHIDESLQFHRSGDRRKDLSPGALLHRVHVRRTCRQRRADAAARMHTDAEVRDRRVAHLGPEIRGEN